MLEELELTRGHEPTYDAYPDRGCKFSPTCITCPLEACRYDKTPPRGKSSTTDAKRQQARLLRDGGLTVQETALRMGMSARGVFALFEREKKLRQKRLP